MGHYLGSYIEIEVNKTLEKKHHQLKCDKGHILEDKGIDFELSQYIFCSKCGSPVNKVVYNTLEYPVHLDDIDDDIHENFGNITPPSLFNTGVIIAISNCNNFRWLYLGNYANNDPAYQISDFPSETDILKMKDDFSIELESSGVLKKLISSPYVNSVKVKAGYVVDVGY